MYQCTLHFYRCEYLISKYIYGHDQNGLEVSVFTNLHSMDQTGHSVVLMNASVVLHLCIFWTWYHGVCSLMKPSSLPMTKSLSPSIIR